jgi:alpha-glucosidase
MRLVTALALLTLGCSCEEATPVQPGTDGGHDASPPDAQAGDSGRADPLADVECAGDPTLPAWAAATGAHRLTASCDQVTLRIDLLAEATARLRYVPTGASPPERSWAVITPPAPGQGQAFTIGAGEAVAFCSDRLLIGVERGSCRVRVLDLQGGVLLDDPPGGGFGQSAGGASVTRRTPPEERFYGFGERTGSLDKRGRRLVFYNTDPYRSDLGGYAADADPLYQSIPFFIGLRDGRAHGIFTDVTHRLEMDMAASAPERYSVRAFGGAIDQYVIAGPAMRDVLRRYAGLTGRPPLPPLWALGFHQSRWGYAPDSELTRIADQLRARSIPADALWLDIQHMDGFRTFTWDPAAFPAPERLLSDLAAKNFRVIAIADPGLKIDPGWNVYESGATGGHFLKHPDGRPYEGVVWPGPSSFPDFSRAATRAWWADHIAGFVGTGLSGIWLDVNEPTTFPESGGETIPDDVLADGDGTPATMAEVHNVYALLESQATWDGIRKARPAARPFILSRAGYAGIQRTAAVWTGDAPSRWDSLQTTLPMLLGMGLSGVGFVGSDVGGYSGSASAELYARWMALGAISPFFRAHVTSGVPGQEPWMFGPEVEAISRRRIGDRYRLLPYLYSLFAEAHATGDPILRPLVYEFQDDPSVAELGDQALFGSHLLFAPVLAPGAESRKVILPRGRWMELESGALHEGPGAIDVGVTLAALPAFLREGAILPRSDAMQWTSQKPVDPLWVDLFPGPDESRFALYEDAGDGFEYSDSDAFRRVEYTLAAEADGATFRSASRSGKLASPARRLIARFRRVDAAVSRVELDGKPLAKSAGVEALLAGGSGWALDENDRTLLVALDDRDAFVLRAFFDPSVSELRPAVKVLLEVEVPADTPAGETIHIATSVAGWTHAPMTWTATPGVARIELVVPRGEWFFYKYTRGGWDSVEKWAGCEEATNRYAFGAAPTAQKDSVSLWADRCP